MDKGLMEFVCLRCAKALEENDEYMKAEMNDEMEPGELQQQAEILCYLQGLRDGLQLMGVEITSNINATGSPNR